MNLRGSVEEHYRTVWGVDAEYCPFSAGPIQQLPVDFVILKYPPHANRKMWTYATCCMSQPGDLKLIELHMFSPWETPEVVELLVVTAHFHRTAERLDLGHSVNFGRPWLDGSECQFGLVSLPYLDGPSLENLKTDLEIVKCYWLVPVSSSEIEYKRKNGVDALEQEFERCGLDYLNPRRKSVV